MDKVGVFFKSDAHKERFLAAVQGHIEDGKLDQWYGSALYILTADLGIWEKACCYVSEEGILFHYMLEFHSFSSSEAVLVRLAWNLFNSESYISPDDLMCLDDANVEVALQSIRLRRYSHRVKDIVK